MIPYFVPVDFISKEDVEFLEKRLIEEYKLKPKQKRNELSLIEKLNFPRPKKKYDI